MEDTGQTHWGVEKPVYLGQRQAVTVKVPHNRPPALRAKIKG